MQVTIDGVVDEEVEVFLVSPGRFEVGYPRMLELREDLSFVDDF